MPRPLALYLALGAAGFIAIRAAVWFVVAIGFAMDGGPLPYFTL